MKKITTLMVAVLVAMSTTLLCSCSKSPEQKAQEFQKEMIKAVEAGDLEAFQEVIKQGMEYEKTLSEEERTKFNMQNNAELDKALEEALSKLPEEKQFAFAMAALGVASDMKTDEINDALDDISDDIEQYEDELEELGSNLDEALKAE